MCLSFSKFPQFSSHIPGPRGNIFHFYPFSKFLAIFQVLSCEFLILPICLFSQHIPGPTVFVPFFPRFSVFLPHTRPYIYHFSCFSVFLAISQVLQCTFLIFHLFQRFLPYSRSYHVSFSFYFLVSFLAII